MRTIMLASLTTGVFLGGTAVACAECQTFAQARASNPNAYLAYRVVAGAHCWYAGHPAHRDVSAGEKPRRAQSVVSSNIVKADAPPPAQAPAPITFRNIDELNTPGALSERLLYGAQTAESNATVSDVNPPQEEHSNDAAIRPANDDVNGMTPEQPRERGPPVGSQPPYLKFVIWALLTIGMGTIGCGIFDLYGERSRLALRRLIDHSWHSLPSAGLPAYRSARTRSIDFIAHRGPRSSSDVPSRNTRSRGALAPWPMSSVRPTDDFAGSVRTVIDEPRGLGLLFDDLERLRKLT